MKRTNKNSRAKGLPPKLQTRKLDNQSRFQGTNTFNDSNTFQFSGSIQVKLGTLEPTYYSTGISSSLVGTGSLVKGITDQNLNMFEDVSPSTITPFKEVDLYAAEGKSTGASFYASGSEVSNVGEGFDQPLWSKDRIVVDLTVAEGVQNFDYTYLSNAHLATNVVEYPSGSSLSGSRFNLETGGPSPIEPRRTLPLSRSNLGPAELIPISSSYMGYFNFTTKTWDPIGPDYGKNELFCDNNYLWGYGQDLVNGGVDYAIYSHRAIEALHTQPIGFTPSFLNVRNNLLPMITSSVSNEVDIARAYLSSSMPRKWFYEQRNAGRPTNQYGFPFAPKFHANEDQVLRMSDYIDRPFMLEKIVLEMDDVEFSTGVTQNLNDIGQGYSYENLMFPAVINNFFILKQNRNANENLFYNDDSWAKRVSTTPPFTYTTPGGIAIEKSLDSSRELVTHVGITSYDQVLLGNNPTEERYLSNYLNWIISPDAERLAGRSLFTLQYESGSIVTSQFFITQSQNIFENFQRDLTIPSTASYTTSSARSLSWRQDIKVEAPVKSPMIRSPFYLRSMFDYTAIKEDSDEVNPKPAGYPIIPVSGGGYGSTFPAFYTLAHTFKDGGSSGLGFRSITGRRLLTEYQTGLDIELDSVFTSTKYNINMSNTSFTAEGSENIPLNAFEKINPYLLNPEDELVFGWQLPIPLNITSVADELAVDGNNTAGYADHHAPYMHAYGFNPYVQGPAAYSLFGIRFNGRARIVLYGSYIDEAKEIHNTTDDYTESVSITKVIK